MRAVAQGERVVAARQADVINAQRVVVEQRVLGIGLLRGFDGWGDAVRGGRERRRGDGFPGFRQRAQVVDAGVVAEFARVHFAVQHGWQRGRRAADDEIENIGKALAGGVVEPVRVRLAAVNFANNGADVPPQAGDGRARQHGLFGDGEAEARAGFRLHFRRQFVQAGEVFREEVEAGEAVKALFLCVCGQFADGLQFSGDAAQLRVNHPPCHVAAALAQGATQGDEAVAQDVVQPELQVGKPGGGFFPARVLAFLLRGRIGRGVGFRRLSGFGFLILAAFFQPAVEPVRRLAGGEQFAALRMQEQQGKPVFAGEFAAGAGAFEGGFAQIDCRLVGIFAATLAMPPQRLIARVQQRPFAGVGQAVRGFERGGVRGEAGDLFGGEGGHGGSAGNGVGEIIHTPER